MSAMYLIPDSQTSLPTAAEKRARLQALKAEVGALDGSLRPEGYGFAQAPVVLPKGAVVELIGSGRHEFIAQFLATQNLQRMAWVEKDMEVFPTALSQRGVNLNNMVFIESGKQHDWVLKQLLQSQVFPFIVATNIRLEERPLRKMQLLAERSGSTLFLSQEDYRPSWVPALSLEISRLEKGFTTQILRKRGAL